MGARHTGSVYPPEFAGVVMMGIVILAPFMIVQVCLEASRKARNLTQYNTRKVAVWESRSGENSDLSERCIRTPPV